MYTRQKKKKEEMVSDSMDNLPSNSPNNNEIDKALNVVSHASVGGKIKNFFTQIKNSHKQQPEAQVVKSSSDFTSEDVQEVTETSMAFQTQYAINALYKPAKESDVTVQSNQLCPAGTDFSSQISIDAVQVQNNVMKNESCLTVLRDNNEYIKQNIQNEEMSKMNNPERGSVEELSRSQFSHRKCLLSTDNENMSHNLLSKAEKKKNHLTAGDCSKAKEVSCSQKLGSEKNTYLLRNCTEDHASSSRVSSQPATKRNTPQNDLPLGENAKPVFASSHNRDTTSNSNKQYLLNSTQSGSKILDHFQKSGICTGFKPVDCPNQSQSLSQVVDHVITKGMLFADELRSLPKHYLEEAEKHILGEIFQIEELYTIQGQSKITPEQPSPSRAINMLHANDPFIAKGMYIAKKLSNLPQHRWAEVERSILHILFQFGTGTHQGISKDTSPLPSLSKKDRFSEGMDSHGEYSEAFGHYDNGKQDSDAASYEVHIEKCTRIQTQDGQRGNFKPLDCESLKRQPINKRAESSETQNRVQISSYNSPKNTIVPNAESGSLYHRSPHYIKMKTSSESHLYPNSVLNELKANLGRQENEMELNGNSQEHDNLSYEEEVEPSVIHPPQKSPKVQRRMPTHTPKTEQYSHVSPDITPKKLKPIKKAAPTKSSSEYTWLYASLSFLVAVIVSVIGAILYYQNALSSLPIPNFQFPNFLPNTNPPSSPQINISAIIDDLKRDFNEQPLMTFKMVKNAIQTLNKINPKEPAIIALLAEKGAGDVSARFARQLVKAVLPDIDVVTISGLAYFEQDPDTAKKAIDDLIIGGLKENMLGGVFVDRLDYIPGNAALIFHTYCDHENAPYKRVIFVMTVESNETQLKLMELKEWDTKFQEHLYKTWSDLGVDQISALMSRLTVRVGAIVPKDES